jgi:hypothetical protein
VKSDLQRSDFGIAGGKCARRDEQDDENCGDCCSHGTDLVKGRSLYRQLPLDV